MIDGRVPLDTTVLPNLEYLRSIGAEWWPDTYGKYPDNDFRAFLGQIERVERLRPIQPEWAAHTESVIRDQDGFFQLGFATRWADQACPVVRIGHKYVAALISTAVHPTIEIRAPWPAFVIAIPPDLFKPAVEHDIPHILVWVSSHMIEVKTGSKLNLKRLIKPEEGEITEPRWSFMAIKADASQKRIGTYTRNYQTLHEFRGEPDHEEIQANASYMGKEYSTVDERLLNLLTRLVLNTCLAMSNPENVKQLGKHAPGWTHGPNRDAKYPLFRSFELGKPLNLDCRPAIQDYLSGKKHNPMSIQCLVRGHWRNQVCGPGRVDRKVIWIEPFWRGDAESPINMREHRLL